MSRVIPAADSGWQLGAVVMLALLLFAPSQYRSADRQFAELAKQERIEDDLTALVGPGAINLGCGPVGVPNHAPIPLLSLYLKASPVEIRSAQVGQIRFGVYVDPASTEVERDYELDKRDPHEAVVCPARLRRVGLEPLVADLQALSLLVDRAPLVEAPSAGRLSLPAAPVRGLPLRLPVIA